MDDEMDDMHDAPHQHEMDAGREEEHGSRGMVAKATVAPDEEQDEESKKLKSPFARSMAKVTPALENWAKRAKTTMALLAARASAKRNGAADDVEIPVRRTTAPAPGGGLHAAGRKVVRGEIDEPMLIEEAPAKPRFAITKKRAMVGGAIGIASILCLVALRKPAPAPAAAGSPADTATAVAAANPAPAPASPAPVMPSANDPLATAAASLGVDPMGGKPGKATPFGNGPVTHGNVLKIKMDGPVSFIQGASQPSGFTVVIPGRKSLDAAGPLAAKDPRIAAIRVSNETGGAELSVTFKDGVPNYQVKAHGDTLEMHLAKPGHVGNDKPAEAKAGAHKKKKHH